MYKKISVLLVSAVIIILLITTDFILYSFSHSLMYIALYLLICPNTFTYSTSLLFVIDIHRYLFICLIKKNCTKLLTQFLR